MRSTIGAYDFIGCQRRCPAAPVSTCKLLFSSETICARGSFFFIFSRHHFDAVEFSTAAVTGTRERVFFLSSPKASGYCPRLAAPRTSLSASQTVRIDSNFAASVARQFSRIGIDGGYVAVIPNMTRRPPSVKRESSRVLPAPHDCPVMWKFS